MVEQVETAPFIEELMSVVQQMCNMKMICISYLHLRIMAKDLHLEA